MRTTNSTQMIEELSKTTRKRVGGVFAKKRETNRAKPRYEDT